MVSPSYLYCGAHTHRNFYCSSAAVSAIVSAHKKPQQLFSPCALQSRRQLLRNCWKQFQQRVADTDEESGLAVDPLGVNIKILGGADRAEREVHNISSSENPVRNVIENRYMPSRLTIWFEFSTVRVAVSGSRTHYAPVWERSFAEQNKIAGEPEVCTFNGSHSRFEEHHSQEGSPPDGPLRARRTEPHPPQRNFCCSSATEARITWPTMAMLRGLTLSSVSLEVCQ
jgi:hypothetical protein